MGRELKRKQAKKDGRALKEEQIDIDENPYSDIYKLLKTFGLLLLIVLGVHFITAVVITKEIELFKKNQKEEEVVVADSILAKNCLVQKEESYYVYFYDFDEEDTELTYLVNGMLDEEEVYKVNTADAFNSNYVTEEDKGNSSATNLDGLKVIAPTLVKVSGGVIVEYYETYDAIKSFLEPK